jgi:putative nucleotidyltransferase with HDIG domain
MEKSQLKIILNKVKDVPTLPQVLVKLSKLVNDPRSSAKDLGRVVSVDQSQTARLLKLINSSFYGFPRKISSATEAIALLGFNAVKNLCLSISIFDLFADSNGAGGFDRERFWQHSIGCAVGGKVLAKYIGYPEKEELFVAGLLHDIGKVVLDHFFHEEFKQIIKSVQEKDILMLEAEKEVLGFTHTEVGQMLAERWDLPLKLVEPIANHHQPMKSYSFAKESGVVHLADILCRAKDLGWAGDNKIPEIDKGAWEALKLKPSFLDPIMREMEQEFSETVSIISNSQLRSR